MAAVFETEKPISAVHIDGLVSEICAFWYIMCCTNTSARNFMHISSGQQVEWNSKQEQQWNFCFYKKCLYSIERSNMQYI